jgi:hypothetical protein
VAVQLTVMLPLFYMCICTYFSLFKLGKFRVYSLTPFSSDSYSLLLCGALICRYSAPMCYNFLNLIPVVHENGKHTVFDQMMGASSTLGAFDLFNSWFPLVLPVFCGLVAFNAFHHLAGRLTIHIDTVFCPDSNSLTYRINQWSPRRRVLRLLLQIQLRRERCQH